MDTVNVTVSEPRRGEPMLKLWHIKGLKDAFGYNLLKTQAACKVEMGEVGNVPVFVEFFLKECKRNDTSGYDRVFIDLYARTVTHQPKLHFVVDLELVDENDAVVTTFSSSVKDFILHYEKEKPEVCIKSNFLYPFQNLRAVQVTSATVPESIEDEYRFKITVTPLHSNETVEAEFKKVVDSLGRDLGSMLAAENNYCDLKLETKDSMTLSAHKFILVARSPYFKTLIEKEAKKEGFKGIIKLEEVNAKPMIAILHWMYTGDIHDNAGRVMEDIVEAAVKFKLLSLLKLLDRRLITICNPGNMFDLYKVAKEHDMKVAIADLAEYIKQIL